MTVFIRQLTGVRFIAAFWVLMYHFQAPLATMGLLVPVVSDVLRVGRLGVDLFFALSGFILTYTYLRKIGPTFEGRAVGIFLWLRLARIWPVHFVMLNVAGLAIIAQSKVTGSALARDWLNPIDYIKNVLLIQEWGPNPQRGWNFVAWSLSMEWLAYLLFPLLILILWRVHQKVPTGWLAVIWVAVLVPLLVYGTGHSDPYYTDNWGSTYRILTEFTAGAITYLIVARLIPTDGSDPRARVQKLATTLSIACPTIVVLGCIVLNRVAAFQPPLPENVSADAEALPPYYHLWLVPFLIVWIGALALSRTGLAKFLSTDRLVLGGFISYSLYMTHLVWYGLWRAGMKAVGINGGLLYAAGFIALVVGAIIIAWAMWKWVEEPAREWMRSKVGVPTKPAGEAVEPKPL
ncbi:MAG: acyltransferase [Actinomycetes bacterium]